MGKHDIPQIARALDKLQHLGIEPTVGVITILEKLWNDCEDWHDRTTRLLGRKDVVDYLKTNHIKLMESAQMGGNQYYSREQWQTQLKAWGISESNQEA